MTQRIRVAAVVAAVAWAAVPAVRAQEAAPAEEPVIVKNLVVDPASGKELGRVAVESHGEARLTDVPGRYRVYDTLVDAAKGRVIRPRAPFRLQGESVVQQLPDGTDGWATNIGGRLGTKQHAAPVYGDGVVVVPTGYGLAAVDLETGDLLWTKRDVPNSNPRIWGDLVVTAGWQYPDAGPEALVIARDRATGAERWRAPLPDRTNPWHVAVAGTRLVVTWSDMMSNHGTRVFTRDGTVQISLDRTAVEWRAVDGDLVLALPQRLVRFDAEGKQRWEHALPDVSRFSGASITPLPGGDLLTATWDTISDSGVALRRLSGATGTARWSVKCPGLGVPHSKYNHHAYVVLRGNDCVVVSQGSSGSIVARRALADGAAVKRWTY